MTTVRINSQLHP